MLSHDPVVCLHHMHDAVSRTLQLVAGKTRSDLDAEELLGSRLYRFMELLAQAAARFPEELYDQYPTIPWAKLLNLHERFVGAHNSVDSDLLWDLSQHDLPSLLAAIDRILPGVE